MKDTAVLCSVKRPSSPVIPSHVAQRIEHGWSLWIQTLVAIDRRLREEESERIAAESERKEQEVVTRQLVEALARKKELEARLEAQAREVAALAKAADDGKRILAEGAVVVDEKKKSAESQLAELEEQLATARREKEKLERSKAQLEEEVSKKETHNRDVHQECDSLEVACRMLEAELEESLQQCGEEDARQENLNQLFEVTEALVSMRYGYILQHERLMETMADIRRVTERSVKWLKAKGIENSKSILRNEASDLERGCEYYFSLISASNGTVNKNDCRFNVQTDHTVREIGHFGGQAAQQPKVLVCVDMSSEEMEKFIRLFNNLDATDQVSLKEMQGFLRQYGGPGLDGTSKAIYVVR